MSFIVIFMSNGEIICREKNDSINWDLQDGSKISHRICKTTVKISKHLKVTSYPMWHPYSVDLIRWILTRSVELWTINKDFMNIFFKSLILKQISLWLFWLLFSWISTTTQESVGKILFSYTLNIALLNTTLIFSLL